MQDIHWAEALHGLLPELHAGGCGAAQSISRRSAAPSRPRRASRRGDLQPVFDWLRTNIWQQGSRHETDELMRRATGEPLNPAHFRAHLEART